MSVKQDRLRKKGSMVKTEEGPGIIVSIETYKGLWNKENSVMTNKFRYGIKLTNDPSYFDPVFYWESDFK